MIKAVFLFLIFIVALALFGRLRMPGNPLSGRLRRPAKCPNCGRYRIGGGPCPCRARDG